MVYRWSWSSERPQYGHLLWTSLMVWLWVLTLCTQGPRRLSCTWFASQLRKLTITWRIYRHRIKKAAKAINGPILTKCGLSNLFPNWRNMVFSPKCLFIKYKVLQLCWFHGSHYQIPSLLYKVTSKRYWFCFLYLVASNGS